jgi:membrane-bound metal-dependent hydrolase YbcI (DUF457 family)
MPSSVAHAMAGVAAAWAADLVPGDRSWRTAPQSASFYKRAGNGLTAACLLLAAAPDLDLIFRVHRTATHSLAGLLTVLLVVVIILYFVVGPPPHHLCLRGFRRSVPASTPSRFPYVRRAALTCAAAYASHLLLDWLAADPTPPSGLQLLWPFSHYWFISGWEWFGATERRGFFTLPVIADNLRTIAREIAILGPVLAALWWARVRSLRPPAL